MEGYNGKALEVFMWDFTRGLKQHIYLSRTKGLQRRTYWLVRDKTGCMYSGGQEKLPVGE